MCEENGSENPRAPGGTTRRAISRRNKNRRATHQQATPGGSPKKSVRGKSCGGRFMAHAATTRKIPGAWSRRADPACSPTAKGGLCRLNGSVSHRRVNRRHANPC
jgi:hypothetical protein